MGWNPNGSRLRLRVELGFGSCFVHMLCSAFEVVCSMAGGEEVVCWLWGRQDAGGINVFVFPRSVVGCERSCNKPPPSRPLRIRELLNLCMEMFRRDYLLSLKVMSLAGRATFAEYVILCYRPVSMQARWGPNHGLPYPSAAVYSLVTTYQSV